MSFRTQYQTNLHNPKTDVDVQNLKKLILKLLQTKDQPLLWHQKEKQYKSMISELQLKNIQLSNKLADLQNKNIQSIKQLQAERSKRKQQQVEAQRAIKSLNQTNQQKMFWTTPGKTQAKHRQNSRIQTLYPSKLIHEENYSQFQRAQTPINELINLTDKNTPSKDQIHRLNSYLVENTTTLKLLLQKHNYLLRIRAKGYPNFTEQADVISKTKIATSDRKTIDQARSILSKSRKEYFDSDHSSSQIEKENNSIGQKEQQI